MIPLLTLLCVALAWFAFHLWTRVRDLEYRVASLRKLERLHAVQLRNLASWCQTNGDGVIHLMRAAYAPNVVTWTPTDKHNVN